MSSELIAGILFGLGCICLWWLLNSLGRGGR